MTYQDYQCSVSRRLEFSLENKEVVSYSLISMVTYLNSSPIVGLEGHYICERFVDKHNKYVCDDFIIEKNNIGKKIARKNNVIFIFEKSKS